MAGKLAGTFSKAIAAGFSLVAAPVIVHHATRAKPDAERPTPDTTPRVTQAAPAPKPIEPQPPFTAPPKVSTPTPPPIQPRPQPTTTQVIVRGIGKTPEDALRDALDNALFHAAASRLDPAIWTAQSASLRTNLAADRRNLVRTWKDLGTRREWSPRGTVYHREASVEVDVDRLTGRLGTVMAVR